MYIKENEMYWNECLNWVFAKVLLLCYGVIFQTANWTFNIGTSYMLGSGECFYCRNLYMNNTRVVLAYTAIL